MDWFYDRVYHSDLGCWIWLGAQNREGGYGVVRRDKKLRYCHRFAWELAYGPIPDGAYVLHRCDRPLCVRPDHLFLGTQAENIADARAKGRLAIGDRNGMSRVSKARRLDPLEPRGL